MRFELEIKTKNGDSGGRIQRTTKAAILRQFAQWVDSHGVDHDIIATDRKGDRVIAKHRFADVAHSVELIVSATDNRFPYSAVTEFGPTASYETERELRQCIDFIFGKGKWKVADRRLG